MDKQTYRAMAIERALRSIEESRTLEQLASTEQFLTLYYKIFPFDSQYFRMEYKMDTQLRNRKIQLIMMDEVNPDTISFSAEKMSLRRLNEHVKSLTVAELEDEWTVLRPQLDGIDLRQYPELHEKKVHLKLIDWNNFSVKKLQKSLMNW
jgi:hypothetical protein